MDPFYYVLAAFALAYGIYLSSAHKRETDAKHSVRMAKLEYKREKTVVNTGLVAEGLSVRIFRALREAMGFKQIEVQGDVVKHAALAEIDARAAVQQADALSKIHIREMAEEDRLAIESAERTDDYYRRKRERDGAAQARGPASSVQDPAREGAGERRPPPGIGGPDGKASGRHRKP